MYTTYMDFVTPLQQYIGGLIFVDEWPSQARRENSKQKEFCASLDLNKPLIARECLLRGSPPEPCSTTRVASKQPDPTNFQPLRARGRGRVLNDPAL